MVAGSNPKGDDLFFLHVVHITLSDQQPRNEGVDRDVHFSQVRRRPLTPLRFAQEQVVGGDPQGRSA